VMNDKIVKNMKLKYKTIKYSGSVQQDACSLILVEVQMFR